MKRISASMRILTVAVATALLSACATMHAINKQSLVQYKQTRHQADQGLLAIGRNVKPVGGPILSDLPYVSTRSIAHQSNLPGLFDERATLNAPMGEAVASILNTVEARTGVTINADPDLLQHTVKQGGARQPATMDATLTLPPLSSLTGAGSTALSSVSIDYQGTVKGMFDAIANALDARWNYDRDSNTVHLYRYETRAFHIDTIPGDATTTDTVSSGGMSGGVQGGQGQTVRVDQGQSSTVFGGKLSVWDSLAASIKPMLSPAGTMVLSEPTATITVHDRWNRVRAIGRFIKSMNAILAEQVEVNIAVYRVQVNNQDNRGINWGLLYNAIGQQASDAGLTIATPRPTGTGLSSLVISAPNARANGNITPWSGSQFFLDALSTLGKTSVVTNASVETVNNQPAPVKVVQTTTYLAQTTSLYTNGIGGGNTGVVGAGATLTPGTVETGFSMQVLPSVQPDGRRILLQAMISVSTLDSLNSYTSGGETIQEPQVSARTVLQRAWLKSGESLVLAGYQDTEADNTTQTPLSKSTWWFGGNRNVQNTRDALVIVITPVAMAAKSTF
jgi:type IVB pilus formation R64 PilN family outer membrane protein